MGMKNAKKPEISSKEIVQMYQTGLSTTQIGKQLGLYKSSVSKRLKKLGIELRKSSDYVRNSRYWLWKGENYLPEITRKRNQRLHRKWSHAVLERDNFTCQDCGEERARFHAHHLIPLEECLNTELEYKISNGITLCPSCHKKRHKKIKLS